MPGVLHLACGTGHQSAGVQRHVACLAVGLQARGYPAWVACPAGSWLHRELGEGAGHVPWSDLWLPFERDLAALAAMVEREGIRVVHAHNRASMRLAHRLRSLTGCAVVATAHTLLHYPEFHWADRRVAVSQAVAECYRNAGPGSEETVIYCGVDTEQFRPLAAVRARVRGELGIPPDAPLVVSTSRLRKKSNVRCFMEAAARVRRARPDACFALIGDGPALNRVETRLLRSWLGLGSRVLLLGERADVPRLLAAADLFVLCSRREGLGLALLEAMACGLPVVASRAGGLAETLVDGESGLFAAPEPGEVADRILELLRTPQRAAAMAGAARARICERFSLSRALDRHEELYRSCF